MRDRAMIHASAEAVWEVLRNPKNMPRWNKKCLRVQEDRTSLIIGTQFSATFRLSGPANECTGEVIEFDPGRCLRIRYFGMNRGMPGDVVETFRLDTSNGKTRVRHDVDMTHAGLPWWIKPIIWLINQIGRKTGPGPVDGLKRLVEAGG